MPCAERRWPWSVVAALALTVAAARAEAPVPVHRERYSMGTMFNVVVFHEETAAAGRAAEEALAEVVRLDRVMSHYMEQSELTRLNRAARAGFVAVDPGLFEVIERAVAFSRLSGGRFDVTIAPLLRVWKQAHAAGRRPSPDEIAGVRRCVGYQHIETRSPNDIRFRSDCLELDLGGIGKGYAVDRAIAVLRSAGIRHATVNAGGSSIGAIGAPPGLDGWPVELGAGVSGHRTVLLRDEALSTSQQRLQRLVFAPGAFGEIIEPGREAPLDSDMTVSVVTPSATDADALSTTLLMLPREEGKALLERFPRAAALWMSPAGDLLDSFHPSRLRLADLR